jgi:hypothetical protein
MAVIGREQLVHQQSGRRGARARDTRPRRRLARAIEITVLSWIMSLLAVSLERFLATRDSANGTAFDR